MGWFTENAKSSEFASSEQGQQEVETPQEAPEHKGQREFVEELANRIRAHHPAVSLTNGPTDEQAALSQGLELALTEVRNLAAERGVAVYI